MKSKKKAPDAQKRIDSFFSHHVTMNSLVHAVGGMGIGVLLTHTVFDPHPVRWGVFLVLVSLVGHYYAYVNYKKRK